MTKEAEKVDNIYQKLLKIQKQISGLGKDKKAFNYSYVTGDKVLKEIKPLMNEHGLLLKQEVLSIENTRQDYTTYTKEGQPRAKAEILSKLQFKFTWIDVETGEKDENLFAANGQNDWDKGVGSAMTYAERYFLLKFFHIATDEDDIDNPDRKPPENEPVSQKEPVKEKQTKQPSAKPAMTQKLFDKCLERIKKGEKDIVANAQAAYEISTDFLTQLQDADKTKK